jgi:hypothetical protein
MSNNPQQQQQNERFFSSDAPEIRTGEGGQQTIFGYWAVYNQRSRVLTQRGRRFLEVILPGAFDNTDFSEVESRFNHSNYLSSEPNLRYGFDQKGAWYEFPFDENDPEHVALARRIDRGEVKGSSFQFYPGKEGYIVENEGDLKVVLHRSIPRVIEFGPVIFPAYTGTHTAMRALDQADSAEIDLDPDAGATGALDELLLQRQRDVAVILATHSV